MAADPISGLDPIPELQPDDVLPIVDNDEADINKKTKHVTVQQLDDRVIGESIGAEGIDVFKGKDGLNLQIRKIKDSATVTVVLEGDSIKLNGLGEPNLAANVGIGEGGVVAGKTGQTLEFKRLKAQGAILISETADQIQISTDPSVGEANTASNQGTGVGVFKQKQLTDLEMRSVKGVGDIGVTLNGDDIEVDSGTLRADVNNAQSDATQALTNAATAQSAADNAQADADSHASRHLEGGADAIANATPIIGGLLSSADKTKLNGIEPGATADQTAAQIKTAYESNTDTNAFTDAEQTKLGGIEALAEVNQTDGEIKTQYESNANTNAFTDAEQTKLSGIEAGATGDQTGAEIKSLYEAELNTNAYTDADQTKLSGIESGATADQTDAEIKTAYENNANTNAFTDAEQTKLSGIEAGATQDAASGVAPPAVAAAGSAGTDTNTYANANHTHAHGNQAGGAIHAAVTQSVNGFMSSVDKTKLDTFVHAWLQYSTNVQQDTAGAGGNLVLSFTTNNNSRPGGVFTKVDASQFRADVPVEAEVSFNLDMDADTNNSGIEAYVTVNGVRQNPTTSRGFVRNNNVESQCLTLPCFLLVLAANDIVRFVMNGREAGPTYSLEQLNTGVSWAKIKAVRLL